MSPASKIRTGRILLALVAVFTIVSPYVADWNATHIYNPRWTPHAKFHNGQTMALGVMLGLACLTFLRKGDERGAVLPALLFASFYWISQLAAFAYPGVAWIDPDLLKPRQNMGDVPIQVKICGLILPLCGVAAWLWRSGLDERSAVDHSAAT